MTSLPGMVVSSSNRVNNIIPLTLLSWNVSNASPSCMAPDPAQRAKRAPFLIRDECLLPSPDIIALQECPSPSFGRDVFGTHGYISMGTRQSHCGYVDLLVREGLTTSSSSSTTVVAEAAINDDNYVNVNDSKRKRKRPSTGTTTIITDFYKIPSVACQIDLPNGVTIAVSSSHLAPYKEGASERLAQCTTLMKLMTQNGGDNCILLGDFNARAAEDVKIENAAGGKWLDSWKCTGSDPATKFTWDTFANRYHGDEGFRFKARFDRRYVRGGAVTVNRFGLIGNQSIGGRSGDYLSDHYGLVVGLEVAGKNDLEDNKDQEESKAEKDTSKNMVKDKIGGEISSAEPTLSTKELRAKRLIAIDRRNKSDSSINNVVDLT